MTDEADFGFDRDDFEKRNAEALCHNYFYDFILELVRGLANQGPFGKAINAFLKFQRIGARHGVDVVTLMEKVLEQAGKDGLPYDWEIDDSRENETTEIVKAALRVFSERVASDPAAKGRLSQRESSLTQAIEAHIVSREERSRRYGGSYLRRMAQRAAP